MRDIPPLIAAALAEGAATLCHCWKITRTDGTVLGFTDHDNDLIFDGTTFHAASGFTAADAEVRLGLAAAGPEVAGALSSTAITEDDLKAGRYDGAEVELWLVDWRNAANPDARLLLSRAELGRVRRGEAHFEAELRTLAARLQQVRGRVFAHGCDAELGDARCRVDLADPAWRGDGAVLTLQGPLLRISGVSGFAAGFFTHGHFEVLSGAATGWRSAVLAHRLADGVAEITLAETPPGTLASGDAVRLIAGCDKSFATCREKFANVANFRGFPHMPGNDFVISYPAPGDADLDGGSMNT